MGLTVARRSTYSPHPASGGPVAGYTAWFDASQITGQADNTALSSWPDLSGNGNNLSQATGAAQPTYYSSTAGKTVNGKPAVWFDGTDDWMSAAGSFTFSQATVFVVGYPSSAGTVAMVGSDTANGPLEFRANSSDGLDVLKQNVANLASSTGTITTGTQHLVAVTIDQTGGAVTFYIDSTAAESHTGLSFSMGTGDLRVGSQALGEFWNGPIAELIVYTSVLNSTDVATNRADLKAKWGTP